jgi:hypothetical protein
MSTFAIIVKVDGPSPQVSTIRASLDLSAFNDPTAVIVMDATDINGSAAWGFAPDSPTWDLW